MSAASLVLGSAIAIGGGPAMADPPQNAVDNHEAAKDGKKDVDNSILDDLVPTPTPTPKPTPKPTPAPVTVTKVLAATVTPQQGDLLPCGGTIYTDGKGVNPDVGIDRLVDADKVLTSECDAFPYELKSIPNGLRFIKPSGYPLAQFFVNVTWYRGFNEPDKHYSVDFEAVEGGFPVQITDCPTSLRDVNGDVVGLTDAKDRSPQDFANLGILDQDGRVYGDANDNGLTQFACIAETSELLDAWADGGPRWKIYQKIWLLGDVIIRSF